MMLKTIPTEEKWEAAVAAYFQQIQVLSYSQILVNHCNFMEGQVIQQAPANGRRAVLIACRNWHNNPIETELREIIIRNEHGCANKESYPIEALVDLLWHQFNHISDPSELLQTIETWIAQGEEPRLTHLIRQFVISRGDDPADFEDDSGL